MAFLTRISRLALVPATLILLISCGSQSSTSSIQTIRWQPDGNGFIQFRTNDPQYYDYIFWGTYSQTDETVMSTVTATVKKQSGSLYSGYGIVFCYKDNNNFYRLLIDAAGQYSVYSRVGGTYYPIIAWTSTPSAHLNNGFGVPNEISVAQQGLNNFSIYFNGTLETTFIDGNFSGGKAGFCAAIHNQANENFPNTPEDVRFKMNSPIVYPQ